MVICVCATRNMYLQLQTVIHMILDTQPSVKRIYAFVEDDFDIPEDSIVQTINVGSFSPAKDNKLNGRSKWTYMTLIRCYFTQLIPQEEKVIYLDLDIILHGQLDELWNMDMTDYAIAGVIDSGVRRFRLPYLPGYEKYVNAGVLVMNLKFIKDHKLDGAIDGFLHRQECTFKDQDAVNTIFFPHIKLLDPQWNSNALNVISEHPIISHEIPVKPWEPNSQYYAYWQSYYAKSITKRKNCMKKVLIACEESQRVCAAFRAAGWEAYSCDILDPSGGHPEWHIKQDVLPLLQTPCEFYTIDKDGRGVNWHYIDKWDLIIAHPPCTYLTVTGNRWFNEDKYGDKARERKQLRLEAIEFFMAFANANCDHIAIENPVGVMSTVWRKPDQIIQPYWFGDPFEKKTCLWLKGLPLLTKTNEVKPQERIKYASGKTMPAWYADAANLPPAERSRIRSQTFPGFAQAMAQQWGSINDNKE